MNGLFVAIKNIAAMAGNGTVICQRVTRVMGERDKVDRRSIGFNFDVRTLSKCANEAVNDRLPGRVANMQDSSTRVRRFLTPHWPASFIVVENHAGSLFQDLI